jgi:hypothetical protein
LAASQSALVDWRWCRNGHDVKPSLTLFTAQLVLLFPPCGFARSSSLKWQQLRRPRNGKPSNKLWPPGPAALGAIVRREQRHSCQCRQGSRRTERALSSQHEALEAHTRLWPRRSCRELAGWVAPFMWVDRARTSRGPVRLAALPLARSLSEREADMSRAIPSHSPLILLSAFSSRACVISTVQFPPFAKHLICQPRSSSTLYFFSDP